MTNQAIFHLAFEMDDDDDDRSFRSVVVKRLATRLDRFISKGLPLLVYLVLLGALGVAHAENMLPYSALYTALGAFPLAYLALYFSSALAWARLYDELSREIAAANRSWNADFDDERILIKSGLTETRMPWTAIANVEDVGSMVIFWYRVGAGFFIANRAFANDLARSSFLAWAAERVNAAKASAAATR